MSTKCDVARIFHHIGQELTKQRIVKHIDLSVLAPYLQGSCDIAVLIALQHLF
jgi:hypothetical protein